MLSVNSVGPFFVVVVFLAKIAGIPISEALNALRRHVGIVFDICHQAVEYENIAESLQKLVNAGIPVFKLQEAAVLYVPRVTQQSIDVLKRYAETIYLTQTIEKIGQLTVRNDAARGGGTGARVGFSSR